MNIFCDICGNLLFLQESFSAKINVLCAFSQFSMNAAMNAFSQMQLKIMVMICMNGFTQMCLRQRMRQYIFRERKVPSVILMIIFTYCFWMVAFRTKKIYPSKDWLQLSNPPKIIPQKDNIRQTIFSRTCWKANEMEKNCLK